ncbi:hypothetical protein PIB30_039958 [Stylosanthes scabra]|uniref:Uncharacterized protein n=1 Tax=Stylosanthes scabra TaxID=79078 RepID=A0ABU6TE55_9FABA|nr:hypothetical protein [Stylosanthes scabra]
MKTQTLGASVQGVRPRDPFSQSQNPILDGLCDLRAIARPYSCPRMCRASAKYAYATAWLHELLSVSARFTWPKTKRNGPPNKACDRTSGPCERAVPSPALKFGGNAIYLSLSQFSLNSLHSNTLQNTNCNTPSFHHSA